MQRVGFDKKVIFHSVSNGSIDNDEVYFSAVRHVCEVTASMQKYTCPEPIMILKGNVRFFDFNMPLLVRVATALNIYANNYDIFNVSCEDAIFCKQLLGRDVFRGKANGDHALILSPKTIQDLAYNTTITQAYKTLHAYMQKVCTNQLLLANPVCYQENKDNACTLLIKAELSAHIWFMFGKYWPSRYFQEYTYWKCVSTHGIK
jgi:hypothetical protein